MTPAEIHQLFVAAVGHYTAGNLSEAEKIYHRILAQHPNNPDALHLLGVVAIRRGQNQAAVTLINRAIEINPGNAEYYSNLGGALLSLERYPAAVAACRKALKLNPEMAHAYNHLGLALIQMVDAEPAAAAARAALALDTNPSPQQSYQILGGALCLMGQPSQAVAAFRQAVRLGDPNPAIHSDLIFTMEHNPRSDQKAIAAELADWNRLYAAPLQHLIKPLNVDRSSDRRLRIGWVSPDFRWHVVGLCLLPILKNMDRARFRNYCYSNVGNVDDMSARIFETADAWRDISRTTDEKAAEIIRSDRIDILVDLALHSAGNRLPLFALKPAPVQITYLGYPGSAGVQTIDYRISDPYIDPPDSDPSIYSERTIHLQHCYLCYNRDSVVPPVAPSPALANGYATFGCLNNPSKICDEPVMLWGQILAALPNSRFILHAPPGQHRRRILEILGRAGVSSDRVEFVPYQSWIEYMKTYNRIDIALDPFPYGGGITSCEALLMGVPIVALRGATAVGRLTYSLLSNIGHADLAASSPAQYVDIATSLAANPARLSGLRATLRTALQNSPVMNAHAAAVNLGNLFRDVWQKYLQGTA
jgi:protein O-GlcNAc transferase